MHNAIKVLLILTLALAGCKKEHKERGVEAPKDAYAMDALSVSVPVWNIWNVKDGMRGKTPDGLAFRLNATTFIVSRTALGIGSPFDRPDDRVRMGWTAKDAFMGRYTAYSDELGIGIIQAPDVPADAPRNAAIRTVNTGNPVILGFTPTHDVEHDVVNTTLCMMQNARCNYDPVPDMYRCDITLLSACANSNTFVLYDLETNGLISLLRLRPMSDPPDLVGTGGRGIQTFFNALSAGAPLPTWIKTR